MMNSKIFGLFSLIIVGSLLVPFFASATGGACVVQTPNIGLTGYWGQNPPLLPCGVTGPNGEPPVDCLECGICGLLMLGQRIIYLMLSLLIFIVAPVRFIWGGFYILVSRGSGEMVNRGRQIITHTVIGLLIGFSAFLIIQTFLWLLGGNGLSWPNINCQRTLFDYSFIRQLTIPFV